MDKNKQIMAALLAVAVLVVAGAAIYVLASKYPYEYSFEGAVIASSSPLPVERLKNFSSQDSFVVSPQFSESGNVNEYMGNAMQLFIVVLSGNGKDVTQLIRVVNGSGNIIECGTNFGDIMQSEVLDGEECISLIDSLKGKSVFIDIRLPDKKAARPEIIVDGNTVVLQSPSYMRVGNTAFSLLKLVFPNAETILSETNEKISVASGFA